VTRVSVGGRQRNLSGALAFFLRKLFFLRGRDWKRNIFMYKERERKERWSKVVGHIWQRFQPSLFSFPASISHALCRSSSFFSLHFYVFSILLFTLYYYETSHLSFEFPLLIKSDNVYPLYFWRWSKKTFCIWE